MNKYERARKLVLLWAGLIRKAEEQASACDSGGLTQTQNRLREIERELCEIEAGRRLWGEGWA